MPQDSQQLREDLIACLPSLVIDKVAAESGQRVVYFAHFEDHLIPDDISKEANNINSENNFLIGWEAWGKIVIKVVSGAENNTLTRLQAETAILEEVRPSNFPKILYSNLFTENPVTEIKLTERLYVTVETYIESNPLNEILSKYSKNEKAVVEIGLGIANAIEPLWSHQRKFVHRDIKPENILITPTDKVIVIDLGIAKETGSIGVTRDGWGMAPLSLGFASPEQIQNDKAAINFKTDFFSIGVLMYFLFSGIHPFISNSNIDPYEIALATEKDTPPPLKTFTTASDEFSDFIEQAMMKSPWQRQRTPQIFIQTLENLQK